MAKNPDTQADPYAELGASDIEAWKRAREFLAIFGRIPPIFTTPIRTLLLDEKNGQVISPASQFLVVRLLKSPTLKAIFYYISLTWHGDRISNSAYLSSSDLMRLYSPAEVAALLATVYAYRLVSAQEGMAEDPNWSSTTSVVTEKVEIGGHLGYAIPTVGAMKGILTGGLRDIALGVFRIRDPEGFKEYKRHLTGAKLRYDLDYEMERWGCTHLDLSGNILQMLGIGVEAAHAFMIGLGKQPPADDKNNPQAYEYKIAVEWIDILRETGEAPDRVHIGQYYPLEKDFHKLLYEVQQVRENGSKYSWLLRTKEDINPHATPQLYQEFLLELQQSQALEEFYQENLPPEILETLSEEDLKEISDVEKGDLNL